MEKLDNWHLIVPLATSYQELVCCMETQAYCSLVKYVKQTL